MTATELFRLVEIRTMASKENKLERQQGRCFWCKKPVVWDHQLVRQSNGQLRYATKDHIFAQTDRRRKQIGGTAWVVACRTCNYRRGDRTIEGDKAGSWEYTDVISMVIAELENRYVVPSAILEEVFRLISTMGTDVPDFMDDVFTHFRRQAMREERGWL